MNDISSYLVKLFLSVILSLVFLKFNAVKCKAYIGYAETKDWYSANEYCECEYGSNLAVIESSTDDIFVRDAASAADISTSSKIWIGLNDKYNDNTYNEWIDGTSVTYTNWFDGNPDNDGDCTHLWPAANDAWNDRNCYSTDGYPVCDCNLYIGVSSGLSWSDAESHCLSNYGTHLATWRNKQEFECLYQSAYSLTSDLNIWIGLYEYSTNNWIFIENGDEPVYTQWNPGQPSGDEGCGEFENSGGESSLNDHDCKFSLPFICNNRRYIGVEIKMTWQDAQSYCQTNYHTSLATLMTSEQITNARSAATVAGIGTSESFWCGFNDINNEGTWEWQDSTPTNGYDNWSTNEPNNSGGNQNCAQVYSNGEWDDDYCANTRYFVCNYIGIDETISTHNYIGINTEMTFDDAESYCRSTYGTSLATVTSDEENTAVYNEAVSKGIGGSMWIGATDEETDGTWIWNDGNTGNINYYYNNWESDEPNGGTSENCIELRTSLEWNDASCSNNKKFVCNLPYLSIGPYVDSSDRNLRYGGNRGYTAYTCYEYCDNAGYAYFSLQDGDQCFCENDFAHAIRDGPGDCDEDGGSWCNFVYRISVGMFMCFKREIDNKQQKTRYTADCGMSSHHCNPST